MSSLNHTVPDDLIPTAEAARLLPSKRPGRHVHISTVLRWVFKGRLRGWRIGAAWFVSRAELLAQVRPVQTRRDDETAAVVEAQERTRETDEVLRRHGIRR